MRDCTLMAVYFLKSNPHPRAYGNFIRMPGSYSRDEKRMPLREAVRKLSYLPATNLKLKNAELSKREILPTLLFSTQGWCKIMLLTTSPSYGKQL